jgi:hypothetical protein
MWINCRWLNLFATNHSEIRRDCAHLIDDCWLLVVFIEGPDLCSLNMEMVSETSEIEVQGCLKVDRLCSSVRSAEHSRWLLREYTSKV